MKLAAHQPCYLPSVSFFQKMAACDIFVLMDHFRYTAHDNINRSKIKTADGACWLSVPVLTKGFRGQRIKETRIDSSGSWQRKHWRSLNVNYAYAPYFEQFFDFFEGVYLSRTWEHLLDLNLEIIDFANRILKLPAQIYLSSELSVNDTGRLFLIHLARKFGCDTYVTETRFKDYLGEDYFAENGITLSCMEPVECRYHQLFGDFVPGLSVVDLIFNEGHESQNLIVPSRV
ncbi:MAG: WbqC family protein [bacterium]